MPGKLKIRIVAARSLPVMDRASDLTDAFVEVRFANETYKTDVFRKSLNPQWNSDWFKFEVDDEVLQDEALELRVLDYDTYSAHDVIGKVYVDLKPLLTRTDPHIISGWFPIYDTMHGVRGELNVLVKVELFTDFNKFRQSSCGIQFFCTAELPANHRLLCIMGFVEELVVNDDPEYQWIDKIRTPRASNEARQKLFSKLSGELQRKIGVKVLELGGNAVIGYQQCFDLEGESGIVVRGIGTAVTLTKISGQMSPHGISPHRDMRRVSFHRTSPRNHLQATTSPSTSPKTQITCGSPPPSAPASFPGYSFFSFSSSSPVPEDSVPTISPPCPHSQRRSASPVRVAIPTLNRRSSESDINSPSRGNSYTGSSGSGSNAGSSGKLTLANKLNCQPTNIELLEFPFFTMTKFPPGFIVHLGGVVSARSVKLLDKIHNPEEPETRDVWWSEIRMEIRSHARSMGCYAVLGYTEKTSISEEIIILSAMGTAAKVNLAVDQCTPNVKAAITPQTSSPAEKVLPSKEKEKEKKLFVDINLANRSAQKHLSGNTDVLEDGSSVYNCTQCHIPYKASSLPFQIKLTSCAVCRRKRVPDVLFTTIDLPDDLQTCGRGTLIQARIVRQKLKTKGENSAKEVSDSLPFMEYELHSQLMNKLKIKGMNAVFGLKVQVCVGETMMLSIGIATAVFLAPLPSPTVPIVTSPVTSEVETARLNDLQKKITEKVQQNRERFHLDNVEIQGQPSPRSTLTDESEDDQPDLDTSVINKEIFVLEIDDIKDEMIKDVLQDLYPPDGFQICNTHFPPGIPRENLISNLQMFSHVWTGRFSPQTSNKSAFSELFHGVLRKVFFKLRKMTPCCLTEVDFIVEIPDEDELQISVTGCCLRLVDTIPIAQTLLQLPSGKGSAKSKTEGDDLMFPMDFDNAPSSTSKARQLTKPDVKRSTSQIAQKIFPQLGFGVELSLQPVVTGGQIDKYLGNYNFFFIRESTSLREEGGLGGLMQRFIAEILAVVRGNVISLGGNALVAYRMTQCVVFSNANKNQCQCLINVCGDAVSAVYGADISVTSSLNESQTVTADTSVVDS
ncbi:C2 domain-containing protein 5-like [Gigantopelta aegis]|uniref:C2 domain-containing protein 5-like n=1 Tax=Gigantopelta aegis TaxID=1735272 RepID=UPI001B888E24|nr:C2 domain-containing protein 5-like [Gigantopelta aegis]